jgi:hypothetical protein
MRLSKNTWEQIKAGYAAGIGLRELARKMNVPVGTVLARSKREGWTQQIAAAKIARQPQLAKEIVKADAINAITPMQSIAAVMEERGQRYRERVAGVSERVIGHVEAMDADEILTRSAQLEKMDTIARRTFGLSDDDSRGNNVMVNIALLGSWSSTRKSARAINRNLQSDAALTSELASRNKRTEFFTVVFYGLRIFCCKTAQLSATRCKHDSLGSPMRRDSQSPSGQKKEFFLAKGVGLPLPGMPRCH